MAAYIPAETAWQSGSPRYTAAKPVDGVGFFELAGFGVNLSHRRRWLGCLKTRKPYRLGVGLVYSAAI